MKDKKIGILTTFANFKKSYSLTGVVSQQLEALVKYGYETVLFVLENFKDEDGEVPDGVEVKKIVPKLLLEPYGAKNLPDSFDDDVKKVVDAFGENMKDIDIMLTHDIIFINSYLPYNVGMRKADLSQARWLHWMHSAPSIRPKTMEYPWDHLYSLPKRSKLVYMNYTDKVRAAEMYGVMPDKVRVVFNPMDPRVVFNMHPLTKKLIEEFDLFSFDVLDVYPLSTTRMNDQGKQLRKVIYLMGKIKEQGKSVCLVVPNAHANAEKEKLAIEEMLMYAKNQGLSKREVVFTSLYNPPEYEHGIPHKAVMDLFRISNLFIFPSVSENCPLILLEAAINKNLLVLNKSFPAMRDFVNEHAIYAHFGSLVDSPRHPQGEENYFENVAKLIIAELNQDKTLNSFTEIKKEFNYDTIFKKQLEPIFYEEKWT